MTQDTLQIRELTLDDLHIVQNMQTNIEDDYILRIFPDLVHSNSDNIYGLFDTNQLLAIAGASYFPDGNVMLGRLRSDQRFFGKGHATELLMMIKNEVEKDSTVNWIGANTNVSNIPARRVLEKIGFNEITTLHSLPLKDKSKLHGKPGEIWQEIKHLNEKRDLLDTVQRNALGGVYPYECYYPFPLSQELVIDNHLQSTHFYLNQANDRFIAIKKDHKDQLYAQVKYFWNDHFIQAGFWETICNYTNNQSDFCKPWIDFSIQGYHSIPDLDAFENRDPWILYGKSTK